MEAREAIRLRRSVRQYTDEPVADRDLDELLRLSLLAPNGGMSQAWSIIVVRDAERRAALADLVIRGGAEYFRTVRPAPSERSAREHTAWADQYARSTLDTYPQVPVWLVFLRVPRPGGLTDSQQERDADVLSVGFMAENLFVAARALGLATVPTVFHWFYEQEFRQLLELPDQIEAPLITPLGHPVSWPEGLPPALARLRRPWRSLVHDEHWGAPRAAGG